MKTVLLLLLIFLMFSAFQINRNGNTIPETEELFITGNFISEMNQSEKQKKGFKTNSLDSAFLSALHFHK